MQVNIESERIKNENLKNVAKFETDLRKQRDARETDMLGVASSTQKDSIAWTIKNIDEITAQDGQIDHEGNALKLKMNQRQKKNV